MSVVSDQFVLKTSGAQQAATIGTRSGPVLGVRSWRSDAGGRVPEGGGGVIDHAPLEVHAAGGPVLLYGLTAF
jgi:hypothetical protein